MKDSKHQTEDKNNSAVVYVGSSTTAVHNSLL